MVIRFVILIRSLSCGCLHPLCALALGLVIGACSPVAHDASAKAPPLATTVLDAEASADAEAIRIRRVADATAESIQKVNQAIQAGGEAYFRYRQIEMLPSIAPAIAQALAEARELSYSYASAERPLMVK